MTPTTWEDLTEVEQRVLDSACEDYTQLWELEAPLTEIRQNVEGEVTSEERYDPPLHESAVAAVGHLVELGLIDLVRRGTDDNRERIPRPDQRTVLADAGNWSPDGPKDIEVVATDAGQAVWTG